MIKKIANTLFMLILVASTLVLAGCGAQGNATPTTDPAAVYTQVAQTVQAETTKNAKLTPQATNPAKPTETQGPTATLRPSSTPLGAGTAAPTSLTPQKTGTQLPTQAVATTAVVATQPGGVSPDKMQYIGQSIADGATLSASQTFTITWTIKNIGTTTWDNTYLVRLFGGPALGASNDTLQQTVKPGGQAKISKDMRAPDAQGDYIVTWVITAPDGHNFGSFTFEFKVK